MTSPNFSDLQSEVLRHLDEATATGATTLALVKDFLNQAHRYRCTHERWPFMLWDGKETLTLTAGQLDYALHPEMHRLMYLYNRTQNEYLTEVPFRGLEGIDPDPTSSSRSPLRYGVWGRSQFSANLTTAEMVKISSSSALDTGATYAWTLRAVRSGGNEVVTITANPNGTTPVTSGISLSKLLSITTSTTWNGTMVVEGNTSSDTFLSAAGSPTYPLLHLLDYPTAADVLEYRFFRHPIKLVNNVDLPDIPAPHSEILVYDALLLFAGYNTEINEKTIRIWTELRDRLERAMSHDLMDGSTIAAQARFIRHAEADGTSTFPYINTGW